MPVEVDNTGSSRGAAGRHVVEIGLLNLLSGTALKSGERQIIDLLETASGPVQVRLRLFSLPAILREDADRSRLAVAYRSLDELLGTSLDGLFVTGAEPRAAQLADEPFWPQLTEVIDWARTNTRSTVWSCLAAHAAVQHLDGIARRRLPHKCSGAYEFERVTDHPLLAETKGKSRVYHSRWNDVSERDLVAAGYEILTRGSIGVDSFIKMDGSLFVFLQGHPEYDAGAIGREYRRDVSRFLSGSDERYPSLPVGYFDRSTLEALRRFESMARRARRPETFTQFPLFYERIEDGGPLGFGQSLFRNWLGLMAAATVDHATA